MLSNIRALLYFLFAFTIIAVACTSLVTEPEQLCRPNLVPCYSEKQDYSQKNGSPIVQILTTQDVFFCSGTVISDDYVLTAAHCATRAVVHISNGDTIVNASTLNYDTDSDIAILRGNFSKFSKSKIVSTPENLKNLKGPFVTCGYPFGAPLVCYDISTPTLYVAKMKASGFMFRGMSGGPIIDKSTMTVIGTNSIVGQGYILFGSAVGVLEEFGIQVLR